MLSRKDPFVVGCRGRVRGCKGSSFEFVSIGLPIGPLSSSFLGLPLWILNINHKQPMVSKVKYGIVMWVDGVLSRLSQSKGTANKVWRSGFTDLGEGFLAGLAEHLRLRVRPAAPLLCSLHPPPKLSFLNLNRGFSRTEACPGSPATYLMDSWDS